MKPRSLCFVFAGSKGVELVRAYPEILSKKEINRLITKCIPYSAKGGEFEELQVDDSHIACYVFTMDVYLKEKLCALAIVFDSDEYKKDIVREFFVETLADLHDKKQLDFENLANLLPDIYKKLLTHFYKFKVSSTVSIEINVPKKKKKPQKDDVEVIVEDVWDGDMDDEVEEEEELVEIQFEDE
jgi:hypothetical protein